MRADEAMNTSVVTVLSDWTLEETALLFAERRIAEAPVVDGAGRAIGFVTAWDLLAFVARFDGPYRLSPHEGASPDELTDIERLKKTAVTEVMSATVPSVDPSTDVREVARKLERTGLYVLRVGRPVGVLTLREVVHGSRDRADGPGPRRVRRASARGRVAPRR